LTLEWQIMNNTPKKNILLVIPFMLVFLIVLIKNAWISDDAYITFRSIENFIHGYGLVHNVGERVQTFTHPLWFFILSGANFIWQNVFSFDYWSQMYYTNIIISVFFSFTTIYLIALLIAKSPKGAILALVILVSSRSFMDYSTSGLENPLTFFILTLFVFLFLQDEEQYGKKIFLLSLLAGLAALNRLDTILFYLPPLLYILINDKFRFRSLAFMFLGFTPIIFWELFSLFYYGTFFPNTAYAKLNTGISRIALVKQGLVYFSDSFITDPVTLISIFLAIILVLRHRQRKLSVFIGSIILYLGYILVIGGDFMSGRFFSPIILIAAILISRISIAKKWYEYGALIVFTLSLGLINSTSPLRTPLSYGEGNVKDYIYSTGIANERAVYFQNMGLLSTGREYPFPGSGYSGKNWIYVAEKRKVKLIGALGVDGYFYGPNIHLIDINSLADPLMSRLPLYDIDNWRIGHFPHQLPEGYLETLSTGENKIHNKNIALYYDKLKFIVRGDLYDLNRIREIINLNLGKYDYLLESTSITP